jgi:SAM-dependent methyltransferase
MKIASPVTEYVYTLYECPLCGSRFFNALEHPVPLDELYDDLAINRAHFPVEFSPKPYWSHQKELLLKLLGTHPKSVLDVGARTGDFLLHFDAGVQKTGVEVSHFFCEIARKRNITMYEDFLVNIEFNTKFDMVTSYAILEHLVDPVKFLSILPTILNNGGILAILIPTHESLKAKFLKNKWHMYSPPEHLNFYSRKILDQFLDNLGFSLIHRYYSIGGMFKPFKKVPTLKPLHKKIPTILDSIPFIKKIPIYDHMFSYYKLRAS